MIKIRGVYGSPQAFWDQGARLTDLGVNAIFVHSGSLHQDMVSRARSEGAKVFAEFATLNGKGYVDQHPEAWAINNLGQKVASASWFMGVCPTEPGFHQYRMDQLKALLETYELDGIWMDYVHWHAQFEEPEPILPETCFCDHCLGTFAAASDLQIEGQTTSEKASWILEFQDQRWRDWRCKVITDWAIEIKKIVQEYQPGALLGLYHCPWTDQEFEGARRRILGLDYDQLSEIVDVFSPMVYHGRMERNPGWVAENINWLEQRLSQTQKHPPEIWPIVQAYDDPARVSPQEFEQVLRGGLTASSGGVMMFTTSAVAKDPEKTRAMSKLYLESKK